MEILNAETSVSEEVQGAIIVESSGSLTAWGTHSRKRFREVDEMLVDDEGNCQLWIHRDAGSDVLYLHEDGSEAPTGVLQYVPDHFLGKDGETFLCSVAVYRNILLSSKRASRYIASRNVAALFNAVAWCLHIL